MRDVDILDRLHALLRPQTYLQLGSRQPERIACATCGTVLVDPAPLLPLNVFLSKPWLKFYAAESDAFFAEERPDKVLAGERIDFAVIDGVASFDQLVRDLRHIERWSHARTCAVVFAGEGHDDLLARYAALAPEFRPDLRVYRVTTEPQPFLFLTEFDPSRNGSGQIEREFVAAASEEVVAGHVENVTPDNFASTLPSHVRRSVSIGRELFHGDWQMGTVLEDVLRPSGAVWQAPPRIVFERPPRGAFRMVLEFVTGGMEVLRLRFHGADDSGERYRDIHLDVGKPGALHHELDWVSLRVPAQGAGFMLELEGSLGAGETLQFLSFAPTDHWRYKQMPTPEMALQVRQADVWEIVASARRAPFAPLRRDDDPVPDKRQRGRRDAVIFAWWVPDNPEAEKVGLYYLGLLRYHHPDSKIYIGINHGTAEQWPEIIRASGLDVEVCLPPPEITVTSDATGFLAALREYERSRETFDLLWFGHTKGASQHTYDYYFPIRFLEDRTFWARRADVERAFLDPKIGLYAARYNLYPPFPWEGEHRGWTEELTALTRIYRERYAPIGLNAYKTFFAIRSSIVRRFCDVVGADFFRLDPREWGGDRWFFKMAFPSIASMQGYEPYITMDMLGVNDPRDDLTMMYDAKQNHRLALAELERWREDPFDFEPRVIPWDHPAWDRVRGLA